MNYRCKVIPEEEKRDVSIEDNDSYSMFVTHTSKTLFTSCQVVLNSTNTGEDVQFQVCLSILINHMQQPWPKLTQRRLVGSIIGSGDHTQPFHPVVPAVSKWIHWKWPEIRMKGVNEKVPDVKISTQYRMAMAFSLQISPRPHPRKAR